MLVFGKVAQLVRACGSYPQCRGFNSLPCYHFFSPTRDGKTLEVLHNEAFRAFVFRRHSGKNGSLFVLCFYRLP